MAKLDDLPQELKEHILRSAPDVATLKCLAHSSPLFLGAYYGRREHIFATVIATEMTPEILYEAQYVAQASVIERGDSWISDVKQLLGEYDKGIGESFPFDITSTELVYVSKFLPALHDISLAFFQSTLSHHPLTGEEVHLSSPTRAEMCKIQRSILRMEMFSLLFSDMEDRPFYRPNWGSPCEELGRLFFSRFELWEVEEIMCMRDFFYRQYDMILRDCSVELRKLFVRQAYRDKSPRDSMEKAAGRTKPKTYSQYREMTERFLSFGFEFLSEVMNEDSEHHKVLLLEEVAEHGVFHAPQNFLSDTLEVFFYIQDMRTMQGPGFRETLLEPRHAGKEGPNGAWSWSVQQWNFAFDAGSYVSYCDKRDYLRSWGYVMWDCSRLDSLKVMSCEARDMQPHGPKAMQGILLSDRPKRKLEVLVSR